MDRQFEGGSGPFDVIYQVSLVRVIWEDMMSSGSGSFEKVYIHPLFILSYRCTPFRYLENIVEESGAADVVVPKFDMHCHESKMTGKDVKLLARKYNIPLDFHPCAPTEGWTMDELPEDHIGLCEQFFNLGIVPIGKIPPPLLADQPIPNKTDSQREVETEDAKVVAAREKKKAQAAKAAAKKKDNKKRKDGAEGSSRAKKKRVPVGTKDATASSSHISSPTPLQIVASVSQVAQRQHEDEETRAPNDEGHSASPSPRGSANESVHHFTNVKENQGKESPPRIEPLVILSGQPTYPPKEPVFATRVNVGGSLCLPNNLSTGVPESQPRTILT
ncbi:hypothetical protein Tco_1096659, partial [Tanacetum coccineum]